MSLDAETAALVIRQAEREIEVRLAEIALQDRQEETRRLEIEHNTRIALSQLDAQAADLKDSREQYNRMLRRRYVFIVLIVFILSAFAGWAIQSGAKEVIIDILKSLTFFAVGGFGGYHYGKGRQEKP